jgi:hypothetical protein
MPFAATAVSMLVLLTLTSPSFSTSSMTRNEARQHFGSVQIYLRGGDPCRNAVPAREAIKADKVQDTADQPGRAPLAPAADVAADNVGEMRWVDRWEDIDGSGYPELARWIEAVQAASPIIERKVEPMFTPSSLVLVTIALVLTLATIEVLFRCTIS